MRAMRRLLPLAFLAACGGGGDGLSGGENYTGTYQVTLHQRNIAADTIACNDFGPEVTGEEMFIKIIPDAFFDDPNLLEMETCDTDPSVCDFSIINFEAHGDHLELTGASTQGGGGEGCALSASRNYATLIGTTIRIERNEWYATTSDTDCDLDDADALIGTPDCEFAEAWEATRQ
jgi:hypothetical protein